MIQAQRTKKTINYQKIVSHERGTNRKVAMANYGFCANDRELKLILRFLFNMNTK